MTPGDERKVSIEEVLEGIRQTRILVSDVTKQLEQAARVLTGLDGWIRELHGIEGGKADDDTLP